MLNQVKVKPGNLSLTEVYTEFGSLFELFHTRFSKIQFSEFIAFSRNKLSTVDITTREEEWLYKMFLRYVLDKEGVDELFLKLAQADMDNVQYSLNILSSSIGGYDLYRFLEHVKAYFPSLYLKDYSRSPSNFFINSIEQLNNLPLSALVSLFSDMDKIDIPYVREFLEITNTAEAIKVLDFHEAYLSKPLKEVLLVLYLWHRTDYPNKHNILDHFNKFFPAFKARQDYDYIISIVAALHQDNLDLFIEVIHRVIRIPNTARLEEEAKQHFSNINLKVFDNSDFDSSEIPLDFITSCSCLTIDSSEFNNDKPCYLNYVNGTTVKFVGKLIIYSIQNNISLDQLLNKLELQSSAQSVVRLVLEAIKLLGNNYINAGHTELDSSKIENLSDLNISNLSCFYGAILTFGRGITTDDLIVIISNTKEFNASLIVGGMFRTTPNSEQTYAQECIPQDLLDHVASMLLNESAEKSDLEKLLLFFQNRDFTTLPGDNLWGLSYQQNPKDLEFALISSDQEREIKISPFTNMGEVDKRFLVMAKIRHIYRRETEIGRYIKDQNINMQEIFPQHNGQLAFHVPLLTQRVSNQIAKFKGITTLDHSPYRIFVKQGVLGKIGIRSFTAMHQSESSLISFSYPVPIKRNNNQRLGMKGYFEGFTIDVLSFSLPRLIELTLILIQQEPQIGEIVGNTESEILNFWLGTSARGTIAA